MARKAHSVGIVRVLVLGELAKGENYGYGLAEGFKEHSQGALTIRAEALYPILHQMEEDDQVKSRWVEAENGRPRKVFALTASGRKAWEKTREDFIRQTRAALKALGA